MDRETNPFNPGAGVIPPEFVGRDLLLSNSEIAIKRLANGMPELSIMFHGLRGVGKTVLLNELQTRAKKYNAITVFHDVNSNEFN